jgi:hypothetical protein
MFWEDPGCSIRLQTLCLAIIVLEPGNKAGNKAAILLELIAAST